MSARLPASATRGTAGVTNLFYWGSKGFTGVFRGFTGIHNDTLYVWTQTFVGLVLRLIFRHHRCDGGHRLRPRLNSESVGFRFLGIQWDSWESCVGITGNHRGKHWDARDAEKQYGDAQSLKVQCLPIRHFAGVAGSMCHARVPGSPSAELRGVPCTSRAMTGRSPLRTGPTADHGREAWTLRGARSLRLRVTRPL